MCFGPQCSFIISLLGKRALTLSLSLTVHNLGGFSEKRLTLFYPNSPEVSTIQWPHILDFALLH